MSGVRPGGAAAGWAPRGSRSLTRAGRFAAALAMVAVLGWAGEVRADPSTGLVVSGVRTTSDQLAFYLTGSQLAPGAALTDGKLSVRVDGVPVATTVRAGVLPPIATGASGVGEQPSRAVMVVLDARWPAAGEPLDDARAAITAYVGTLPGDVSAGLVVVSELVRVLVTPTTDREMLTAALDGVTAQGDLPLAEGVHRALEYLPTPIAGGQRRVLLVSDGGPIGPPEDSATGAATTVDATVPRSVPIDVLRTGVHTVDVALRPNAEELAAAATAPPELSGLARPSGGQLRTGSAADIKAAAGAFSGSLVVSATTPGWFAGRSTTVTVEAMVAGRRLTTVVPVRFPARPAAGSADADSGFGPAWLSGPIAAGVATLMLLALVIVWMRWALATRTRRRRLGSIARYGTAARKSTSDGGFVAEPMPVPWPVRLDPAEVRASEAVGMVATVAALAAAGLVSVRTVPAQRKAPSVPVPVPVRPPRLALTGPKPRLALTGPPRMPTQRPALGERVLARLADDTVRLPRVELEPLPAAPAARTAVPMPVAMLAVLLILLGRLFGA